MSGTTQTSLSEVGNLGDALVARRDQLREPTAVMSPERMGAARPNRYSFSRSLLRRANARGWSAETVRFDIDVDGQGDVAYRIDAEGYRFTFVAFLQTLPEDAHTDRVIAERWEIAATLVEGDVDDERHGWLRQHVCAQEDGRFDTSTLALTRGNRSVRFFGYLVDELSAGRQPDPGQVGDAGYIMRSTAFYGNGKYGMRSFEAFPDDHPLAAPYRAQFLAAWCYRELSIDVVEHCARLRGGDSAATFDSQWGRFFGLGNATGLGLVPYAFKHPQIINAWVGVRELALARVRNLEATDARWDALIAWLERAEAHYLSGTSESAEPFLSPAELVPLVRKVRAHVEELATGDRHARFDDLMTWAMAQEVELAELVVAALVDLDELSDEIVDSLLRVDEAVAIDFALSITDAKNLLDQRFDWAVGPDVPASTQWWVYSDNTEEPRRLPRAQWPDGSQDMAIDIAGMMHGLAAELSQWPEDATLGEFVADSPEFLGAVERLFASDQPYGEPRDHPCADGYLPLQVQRLQLAQYGMDNFKPKSTDWLRVTLFQGAPRFRDLADGTFDDGWMMPALPEGELP